MPESAPAVTFRITYERYADVRDDAVQMEKGGLLVKLADVARLERDMAVGLELVLPGGATFEAAATVLHVFEGVGVAVTVTPELLAVVQYHSTGRDAGTGPARHERVVASAPAPAPAVARTATTRGAPTGAPALESLTHAEKIQLALHGTRDQRNAIIRDTNRALHPYVLKNPQTSSEDVLAIAKNAQMHPDLLEMIAARREWFQRPQIALALAKNPKTPPDVAIRALDYVPVDALRLIAKGTGALPHVVAAARKKVLTR